MSVSDANPQIAWKLNEWRQAVPLSPAKLHAMIAAGKIRTAKVDGARLILESPRDFLARHTTTAPEVA